MITEYEQHYLNSQAQSLRAEQQAHRLEVVMRTVNSAAMPPYDFLKPLWQTMGPIPLENALDDAMKDWNGSELRERQQAIYLLYNNLNGTNGSITTNTEYAAWTLGKLRIILPTYTMLTHARKDPEWMARLMLGPRITSCSIYQGNDDKFRLGPSIGPLWEVTADSELGEWLKGVRDYDLYIRAITKAIIRGVAVSYPAVADNMRERLATAAVDVSKLDICKQLLTISLGRADQLMRTINPAWGYKNSQPSAPGKRKRGEVEYFESQSKAICAMNDDDIASIKHALDLTLLASLDKTDPMMPTFEAFDLMELFAQLVWLQAKLANNYPICNITASVVSLLVEHPALSAELDMTTLRAALDQRTAKPYVAMTIREAEVLLAYGENIRDPTQTEITASWWEQKLRGSLRFAYRNRLDRIILQVVP